MFIVESLNGTSVWAQAVDEVSSAVFEREINADLPSSTQLLSPRLFKKRGGQGSDGPLWLFGEICGGGLLSGSMRTAIDPLVLILALHPDAICVVARQIEVYQV